jgi:hypothetical protein
MNELQFGNRIRQVLNQSARLDARTAERLRAARERALARQRLERTPEPAWVDNVTGRLGGLAGISLRLLLPALVLALSLYAIRSWQQTQRVAEVEEIDANLLTDELPLDAYLDKGFEAWLKRRGG